MHLLCACACFGGSSRTTGHSTPFATRSSVQSVCFYGGANEVDGGKKQICFPHISVPLLSQDGIRSHHALLRCIDRLKALALRIRAKQASPWPLPSCS